MSLRLEVNPRPRRTLEQAAWHLTDPPQLLKGNQKERRSERRRLDLLMMRVFLIAMHSRTELLETCFPPQALLLNMPSSLCQEWRISISSPKSANGGVVRGQLDGFKGWDWERTRQF